MTDTKDSLQARHGWKAADVVKRLEGARMAAQSAHAAELSALSAERDAQSAEFQAKIDALEAEIASTAGLVSRARLGHSGETWESACQTQVGVNCYCRCYCRLVY